MQGNDNLPAVARGNQLCNLLGLDVISTGAVIAFAMECYENGILTDEETQGRSLKFGDADAMLWLIEAIANREGLGALLSKGVKKAARQIGRGAERFAFHVKGNEPAFHDGRGKTGMAMGFALSATGADHIETPHDVAFQGDAVSKLFPLGVLDPVEPLETNAAKVRFFALGQKAWGINNCLGLCNFVSVPIHAMTFPRLVESVCAITGWDTSLFELLQVSERSNVMARVFNYREGFSARDDHTVARWHEKMPNGPLKGRRIDPEEFQTAQQLYYEISGWDAKGMPTLGKLVELNLDWLVASA
jgi:aldehyde:ferredoxin oxidoreductase